MVKKREAERIEAQKRLAPPLPSDPDEAAAIALAAILDPAATLLPGSVFKEMARRNAEIEGAPEAEIKATLARQICLLEATATRLFQKSTTASTVAASNEFIKVGLATQRVLIQALGAVHAMQPQKPVTHTIGGNHGVV
ncbi:MAG: hypothetical protein WBH99_00800 [Azovibrio sp.]|uniref:hypothetical protein n=1 Tax=Azovibrio sp. TaxID=1872673 RepID=UPI003C736B23